MRCPNCNWKMSFDTRVFRGSFTCRKCATRLFVSETYTRLLVGVSLVLGLGLPWATRLSGRVIDALGPLEGLTAVAVIGFLFGFVILFLTIRVVPHLIPPSLVRHHNDLITKLNLEGAKEDPGSRTPREENEN